MADYGHTENKYVHQGNIHPNSQKENDPFSKENIEAYNKMPKNLDPTGILPDSSYLAGKN